MTATQKKFLALLKGRMENGEPEKPIFDFITARIKRPQELWECLEAFMTRSAKYGIETKSMQVFWGLVANVLVWGEPYYALELEYRVRPEANNQWSARFAALYEDWKKEAIARIAGQKKKATYIDFRRLERLKEMEEDIEAAKKAEPAPTHASSKETKHFLKVFHRHMRERTKAARYELDKVIESLSGEPLERALDAYLDESQQYAPSDTHSLYAFFGMSSRALYKCRGYFALKFEQWIKPDSKSIYARRYEKLEGFQITQLEADLKHAKAHTRILDELRFAYYKVHAKDPDDRALREFEAITNDELRREVSGALARYDRVCAANDLRGFSSAWDGFSALLARKDRMTVAMVVKWCRDWLTGEREMRDELYWNAVGALLMKLLRDRPNEYTRGFNVEEKAFFVSANKARHAYLEDFNHRLFYLWTSRQESRFAQICKTHAALMLYAARRNMRLATMNETAKVHGKMEALRKHGIRKGDIVSISVTQPQGLLKDRNATVSLGQTFGDLAIVWFDGQDTAYLECRKLEKVLFVMFETVYSPELGKLTTARFYDELYEGTKELLVVLPFFFEVLSYLPDLVSGGLMGLAKSIALQYGIEKGAEIMLGDTAEAKILASSLTMSTGHWAHADNAATKNIGAELRGAQSLEHGAFSARGLPIQQESLSLDVPPGMLSGKGSLPGGTKELATLDVHPIAPSRSVAGVDATTTPRIEPDAPAIKPDSPPTNRPTKGDKLADLEASEQRELVSSRKDKKSPPRKKSGSAGDDDGGKGPPRPPPSEPPKKPGGEKADVTNERGKDGRATGENGVPAPAPKPPKPPRAPEVTLYATPTFVRSGVPYRFVGTLDDFNALQSAIPTRFQVYVIRDSQGRTVYVGITGGETRASDALDRLRQHLYTKNGEFVGDAATIQIVGRNLDERVARGYEDHLIDQRAPYWNNRERDPQSYVRKYGQKPSLDDVRAAGNANLWFRIDLLPL